VPFGSKIGPGLSGDRVQQQLAQMASEREEGGLPNAAPMDGIWIGAAVGIVLWIAVAAIVVRLV
jgi:hypothetical protein